MYKAEIIADSLNPQGNRLTTFVVTYPRIVHAEMCRHRMHSRNTASSRAIPFAKMVKDVQENPFIPIAWQKDHKGMQGTEYLNEEMSQVATNEWLQARDQAVRTSKILNEEEFVTKQLCNRLLEPFVWTTEIISGTEWENFFELRCPKYELDGEFFPSKKDWLQRRVKLELDWKYEYSQGRDYTIPNEPKNNIEWLKINKSQADIHIQAIAELIWDAYNESTPKQLKDGEWHIPFGDRFNSGKILDITAPLIPNTKVKGELGTAQGRYLRFSGENTNAQEVKIKIATARCARVSYLNFEGKDDYEADIKLHDRLRSMKHWSPFEHSARVMSNEEYYSFTKSKPNGWCRNYRGFIQYRHLIEH